jgi:hypothetical protein
MPLPQEIHRRLQARAVTDPDLASLLAIVKNPDEPVSEPPLDHVIEGAKVPMNRYDSFPARRESWKIPARD